MVGSDLDRALALLGGLVVDEEGTRWGQRATDIQWADARALLDRDGPRKHWLGRSRGYSKTDDLACVSVTVLLTQLSMGAEAIAVAASRDQARILIDRVRRVARWTPELGSAVTVGAYHVDAGDVRLEAVPSDAPAAWGRSPAWAIVDEICQHESSDNAKTMWEAISTAVPKVKGRLAVISTAGDPAHWSRGVYEHALSDPLWRVSEVHGPAPWLDPEELEGERRRLPESAWLRFFENRWVATESRLLSFEDIQACALLPDRLDPEMGRSYVLGVDLAVKSDNAVVAVCHVESIEGYGEDRRVVVDSLDVFSPSKRSEIDLRAVEDCVRARSAQYHGAAAIFDPAQALSMMQRLRKDGLTVLEHTFSASSNSRRALLLLELVRGRRLWLPDDEATISEFASVRLRETSPGVYRYDHDSGKHDDRVTAISLAALNLLERPAHDYTNLIAHGIGGLLPNAPGRSKWADAAGNAPGSLPSDVRGPGPAFSNFQASRWRFS